MDNAMYAYPWDVMDDPGAAAELAGLGLGAVNLAALYHSVRALMPHNPRRTVLSVPHAATYLEVAGAALPGTRLRPARPTWTAPDAFVQASAQLAAVGVDVNAWMVLTHTTQLARAHPELAIRSVFGDVYEHALCPAQPEVQAYAAGMVRAVAQVGVHGIELEAAGYLGVVHGSHHDKAQVPLDGLAQFLLSLCVCQACAPLIAAAGGDPDRIAARAREHLRAWFARAGAEVADRDGDAGEDAVGAVLGEGDAGALFAARQGVVEAMITGVQAAGDQAVGQVAGRPRWYLHASQGRDRTGPAAGVDLTRVAPLVDGIVVPTLDLTPDRIAQEVARAVASSGDTPVLAHVAIAPGPLAPRLKAAVGAGARGVRWYHYGLAPRPALREAAHLTNALDVLEV